MNLSPIVPALISIASLVIVHILNMAGASGAKERALQGVYRCSVGLRIFLWGGALLLILCPFIFVLMNASLGLADWMVVSGLDVFIIVCCVYADRYKVILGREALVLKGFGVREINYSDINSVACEISVRGNTYLIVGYSSERIVRISGYLQNFQDLVDKLKQRINRSVA